MDARGDEVDDLRLPGSESRRRLAVRQREEAQHLEQRGEGGAREGDLAMRDRGHRTGQRGRVDLASDEAAESDPRGRGSSNE